MIAQRRVTADWGWCCAPAEAECPKRQRDAGAAVSSSLVGPCSLSINSTNLEKVTFVAVKIALVKHAALIGNIYFLSLLSFTHEVMCFLPIFLMFEL